MQGLHEGVVLHVELGLLSVVQVTFTVWFMMEDMTPWKSAVPFLMCFGCLVSRYLLGICAILAWSIAILQSRWL